MTLANQQRMQEKREQKKGESSMSHQFAIKANEWAMANLGPEPGWDKAHTPLPDGQCDTWRWLPKDLHQHHGILQSEDVGRRCFWTSDAKRWLYGTAWPDNWFYLCDLFEKWSYPGHVDFKVLGKQGQNKQKEGLTPEEWSELQRQRQAKRKKLWVVTFPDGHTEIHLGLTHLCEKYQLHSGKLAATQRPNKTWKTRRNHKGFSVKIANLTDTTL